MHALRWITVLTLFLPTIIGAAEGDSLRVEVLLNEAMLREHGSPTFVRAFDLTPERLLLLASSKQMYLLGWGGFVPVGHRLQRSLTCFAHTSDGLLMVVHGTKLTYINGKGHLVDVLDLASPSMCLAPGQDKMLLYEQRGWNGNGLFAFFKGGQYKKLLESPDPIEAVAEVAGHILVATGKAIYNFSPGQELQMLVAAPHSKRIQSLAVDPDSHLLYFSTEGGIYALRDKEVIPITESLSGLLKWRDQALFVFDPTKSSLLRLTGISETISLQKEGARSQ